MSVNDERSHTDGADRVKRPGQSEHDLSDLVAGYVDRLNNGESLTPEDILDDHPELGLDILTQVEAFMGLGAPAHEAPPLGTLGDYTLRRQIGRGGMGVVYEAWENSMDRRVAVKVLPIGVAADDRSLHRFVREAKAAGKLNHPNVVSVYGMGLKEQTPYYAMELVEGETLGQVLARIKDLPPESDTPLGKKDDLEYFKSLARTVRRRGRRSAARPLEAESCTATSSPRTSSSTPGGRLRILDFGLAHLEGQEQPHPFERLCGYARLHESRAGAAKEDPGGPPHGRLLPRGHDVRGADGNATLQWEGPQRYSRADHRAGSVSAEATQSTAGSRPRDDRAEVSTEGLGRPLRDGGSVGSRPQTVHEGRAHRRAPAVAVEESGAEDLHTPRGARGREQSCCSAR